MKDATGKDLKPTDLLIFSRYHTVEFQYGIVTRFTPKGVRVVSLHDSTEITLLDPKAILVVKKDQIPSEYYSTIAKIVMKSIKKELV